MDLTSLNLNYLPRTNYIPAWDSNEYLRRSPNVRWISEGDSKPKKVIQTHRICYRAMIGSTSERTLTAAIYPPGVAHIHGVRSYSYKNIETLVIVAASHFSLPFYLVLKSSGVQNLHTT